eukprot:418210_1
MVEQNSYELVISGFMDHSIVWMLFLFFYYVIFKKFAIDASKDSNTNNTFEPPSMIHSILIFSSSLPIAFSYTDYSADDHPSMSWFLSCIMINGMCYFIMDSVFLPSTLRRFHHLVACLMQFSCLYVPWRVGSLKFYFYAEIGAVLFHVSKLYKDSIEIRILFVVSYAVSRVFLTLKIYHLYFAFTNETFGSLFYWSGLLQFSCGIVLCIINYYFLFKSTQYLHTMFMKKISHKQR